MLPPMAALIYRHGFLPPIVVDLNDDGKPDMISQTLTVWLRRKSTGPQRSVDVLLNHGRWHLRHVYAGDRCKPAKQRLEAESPYGMGCRRRERRRETGSYPDRNGHLEANLDAMVLLGNGDGTFQPADDSNPGLNWKPHRASQANDAFRVSVEDLNLDGKQDLIFSNGQVALGNGDGTFVLSPRSLPIATMGETRVLCHSPWCK